MPLLHPGRLGNYGAMGTQACSTLFLGMDEADARMVSLPFAGATYRWPSHGRHLHYFRVPLHPLTILCKGQSSLTLHSGLRRLRARTRTDSRYGRGAASSTPREVAYLDAVL